MDAAPPQPVARQVKAQPRLTLEIRSRAGDRVRPDRRYVDVAIIILKRFAWNGPKNYGHGVDFPWSVPVGHAALLLIPGLVLAMVCWIRPRPMSLRAGTWLFATLRLVGLAAIAHFWRCQSRAGLGPGVADQRSRRGPLPTPAAVAICGRGDARYSGFSGRNIVRLAALREYRAISGLPAAPSNARNVVLIVWDAVRAANLSLYGYPRNTTPNLARWARKGVRYEMALAPPPGRIPPIRGF